MPTRDGNTNAPNFFGTVGDVLRSKTTLVMTSINEDFGPAMDVHGITDSVENVVNTVAGEAVAMEGDAYDIEDITIAD